jgi:hypothetical protein
LWDAEQLRNKPPVDGVLGLHQPQVVALRQNTRMYARGSLRHDDQEQAVFSALDRNTYQLVSDAAKGW